MAQYTYNPSKVTWVWGGIIATGYADDEFIAVERMTDTWMDSAGTDGYVTRSRSNDNRGTITVTLAQSSPTNDAYQAQALADEVSGTAAAYGLLRDASGRTICSADTCWIVKPPAISFGRSATNRVWVFRAANIIIAAGGSGT